MVHLSQGKQELSDPLIGKTELLEGVGYVHFGMASVIVGFFWQKHILSHLVVSRISAATFYYLAYI